MTERTRLTVEGVANRPQGPEGKFLSDGLSTQKCLSPTTNTLCRTAPWLTKLWRTQGGWISTKLPALKIKDICTGRHKAESHEIMTKQTWVHKVEILGKPPTSWDSEPWATLVLQTGREKKKRKCLWVISCLKGKEKGKIIIRPNRTSSCFKLNVQNEINNT